ncbi:uncharacterized protein LOC129192676 isoform X2 [Dunckerocampus dactyliophorus]|uniref:uncharacterized protein LOC129192676 isoform X2 n=1 Tax=Dunckerocampus dactyliophorus TaxID=161453 RepID=UPI002407373F|nr:uncharacterized protein LOC129192676 isoform X2 [Dunckerocampus dactyliophorus]
MAGHQWKDWFEREELIGQISDMRVQNLQEREVVQKRTFTRWINLHLKKCDQPIEVQDLFQEIQDGQILMALLEELSGCKLLHGFKKSSHRIFRLNNIAKVLSFLEERNVKLVSIDAADVADGNSSIILGLIWNIILFFQIKELTGNIRSQFPSSSSLSSIPTSLEPLNCSVALPDTPMAPPSTREHSKAITKLLQWVQKRTRRYGVAVQDFGKSWTSGLAFLAVIKSIDTSLVDMRKALLRSARENLEDAFRIAHYSLGIPRLLEPEDVTSSAPDEQSIMTYVSQFLQHFPGTDEQREPYPLMERSISLGRLNFRHPDPHHRATSAYSSRETGRSFVIQKDCAQPPPKILFSSVSEDRGGVSPAITPAITRTFSEDLVADSSSLDVKELTEDVLTGSVEQLTDTPVPIYSSLAPESFMMDSAINSPDSWVESEDRGILVKLSASQSDSSLYGCTTPWDVDHATPVEMMAVDGAVVHIADKVLDEQSMTESSTDEGLFSLSSFNSMQEHMLGNGEQKVLDNNGVNVENHEDFPPNLLKEHEFENEGEKAGCVYKQTDADYPQKEQQPPGDTVSSCGGECQAESDAAEQSQDLSTCPPEPSSKQQVVEKCSVPPSPCTEELQGGKKMGQDCNKTHPSEQTHANDFLQDDLSCEEAEKLSLSADEYPQESVGPQAYCDQEVTEPCCVPPSADGEQAFDAVRDSHLSEGSLAGGGDEEMLQVEDECKNTDCLSQDRRSEDEGEEGPTGRQNEAIDGDIRCCPGQLSSDGNSNTTSTQCARNVGMHAEDMRAPFHDPRQDAQDRTTGLSETAVCYEVPDAGGTTEAFPTDLCQATPTEDVACDFMEPMDLFYPNKDEHLDTEPPDDQIQSWPTVFSVSALEPAPSSKMLPEEPPLQPVDHDFLVGLEYEDNKVTAERDSPSAPKKQVMIGLTEAVFPPTCDGLSEAQHDSQGSAKENTKPVSHDIQSWKEEVLVSPVLRHRKGLHSSQATDNGMDTTAFSRKRYMDDSECCWSESWEAYLLFVSWLLLYCFWLLPPMDVNA